MLNVFLQILDSMIGFPTGFDVIADGVDQYIQAQRFINSIKLV